MEESEFIKYIREMLHNEDIDIGTFIELIELSNEVSLAAFERGLEAGERIYK